MVPRLFGPRWHRLEDFRTGQEVPTGVYQRQRPRNRCQPLLGADRLEGRGRRSSRLPAGTCQWSRHHGVIMSWFHSNAASADDVEHLIAHWVRSVKLGRFERPTSGLTAFTALVTLAEVFAEHLKATFGDKSMSSPVLVTPPVVIAGSRGCTPRAGPRPSCRLRGYTPPTVWPVSSSTLAAWPASPTAVRWRPTAWRSGRRPRRGADVRGHRDGVGRRVVRGEK